MKKEKALSFDILDECHCVLKKMYVFIVKQKSCCWLFFVVFWLCQNFTHVKTVNLTSHLEQLGSQTSNIITMLIILWQFICLVFRTALPLALVLEAEVQNEGPAEEQDQGPGADPVVTIPGMCGCLIKLWNKQNKNWNLKFTIDSFL